MYFQHSPELWRQFPELVAGVVAADGITDGVPVDRPMASFNAIAQSRLSTDTESELPEIQAWRRAFARMGFKPTQYRCASESLLRRFRKEGSLPRIHPLIDLCNAASLAFAIPIAAFDVSQVAQYLEVRHATGEETYQTFAGDEERPGVHEVIFADGAGRAHARRWTNRQSGRSAVQDTTTTVLIVAEALHVSAAEDVSRLVAELVAELSGTWSTAPKPATLNASAPRFEF